MTRWGERCFRTNSAQGSLGMAATVAPKEPREPRPELTKERPPRKVPGAGSRGENRRVGNGTLPLQVSVRYRTMVASGHAVGQNPTHGGPHGPWTASASQPARRTGTAQGRHRHRAAVEPGTRQTEEAGPGRGR